MCVNKDQKGERIGVRDPLGRFFKHCSVCGARFELDFDAVMSGYLLLGPECPSCGADLRGGIADG